MNLATPREVEHPPNILHARRNLKIALSDRQVQILIGTVLGDGYISRRGQFQLEHSDKSKEYLFWKYNELKSVSYGQPSLVERTDKRNGVKYRSYRFWLRQYFRLWREYFYQEKDKIFPAGLKLTPLILAVWYMDDGCYSDNRCIIATDCFSEDSLMKIQKSLKELFDLDTYVRTNKKVGIRASSFTKFFSLIRPYIHESMLYKML